MRFIDLLRLSTRMFRTRPSRTALTVLGVSVGIGAIVFLISLGYGLQRLVLEQITTADSLLSLDVVSANEELIPLDKASLEKISSIENVQEIHPLAAFSGQITVNNLTSDVAIFGVTPAYFKFEAVGVKYGKVFEKNDQLGVVLSSALLKSFGLDPAAFASQSASFVLFIESDDIAIPTKSETLNDTYTVVGVVDDDFSSFAYMPLNTIEREVSVQKYGQIKVRVSEAKYMQAVRDTIIEMGFVVSALAETVDEAGRFFFVIRIILAIFGLIALFISAIGMANTMTVTLLERTNEIGIMKAIGASNKDIAYMFLTESLIMGLLGGVAGIGLGFLGSKLFNGALNLLAQGLGGQSINLFYTPPWFIALVIGVSAVVGILTGVFPARRAALMNPLQALRYK